MTDYYAVVLTALISLAIYLGIFLGMWLAGKHRIKLRFRSLEDWRKFEFEQSRAGYHLWVDNIAPRKVHVIATDYVTELVEEIVHTEYEITIR